MDGIETSMLPHSSKFMLNCCTKRTRALFNVQGYH